MLRFTRNFNWKRAIALLQTSQVSGWLAWGVVALNLSDERFAEIGYSWIDREVFGALALCIGVLAAFYRWFLQEHPVKWGAFATVALLPVLAIGVGFIRSGAPTGACLVLMVVLAEASLVRLHKQQTVFYEALRRGLLQVDSGSNSPQAERFRQISLGELDPDGDTWI